MCVYIYIYTRALDAVYPFPRLLTLLSIYLSLYLPIYLSIHLAILLPLALVPTRRYSQTRRIIVRACSIPPYILGMRLPRVYVRGQPSGSNLVVTPPTDSSFAVTKWKTGPSIRKGEVSARFRHQDGLSLYVPKNHLRSIRGFHAI